MHARIDPFKQGVDNHHAALFRFARLLGASVDEAVLLTRDVMLAWRWQRGTPGIASDERAGLLRLIYKRSRQPVARAQRTLADDPVLADLARIDRLQRACIGLFYGENLPLETIAEVLGLKPEIARDHLIEARAVLAAHQDAGRPQA